jgi:hypothetical protein
MKSHRPPSQFMQGSPAFFQMRSLVMWLKGRPYLAPFSFFFPAWPCTSLKHAWLWRCPLHNSPWQLSKRGREQGQSRSHYPCPWAGHLTLGPTASPRKPGPWVNVSVTLEAGVTCHPCWN